MKTTVLLIVLFLTAAAAQQGWAASSGTGCPNLSGRYAFQGEDGISRFTINQDGCKTIKIETERMYLGTPSRDVEVYHLDKKAYSVPREKNATRTSRFEKNQLIAETIFQSDGTVSKEFFWLNADGNLGFSDGIPQAGCGNKRCENTAVRLK